MTASAYDNWKTRLEEVAAGIKTQLMTYETEPEAGYWRKPVKDKTEGGASITTDWEPVALWPDGNRMLGVIGRFKNNTARNLDHEGCAEIWTSIVRCPISYGTYQLVSEQGGEWPDAHRLKQKAEPKVEAPAVEKPAAEQGPVASEEEIIKTDITTQRARLTAIKKIETAEQDTEVGTIRAALAQLRLKAEREQKAETAPHFARYKAAQEKWNPTVHIGKLGEGEAKALQDVWATAQKNLRDEAEAAERLRLEREAEQIDRWVDHAVEAQAQGEEAPPLPEESAPIVVPTAPPQARAGNGRVRKSKNINVVTITDVNALFAHFCKEEQALEVLTNVLQQLAQVRVNAGEIDIPGITTEEKVST